MSVLHALQAALRREHAAIYGYGVIGAHLTGDQAEAAMRDLAAHQAARDRLQRWIRSRHETPPGAEAEYPLPFEVTDAAAARKLAARIERGVAGAYLAVVAAGSGDLRRDAAVQVRHCAVRQARWSGTIDALPGLRR